MAMEVRHMMKISAFWLCVSLTAAAEETTIDPEADRILKAACSYIAAADSFTVDVEVWKDRLLATGQKIQTTRQLKVCLRRPGQLRMDVITAGSNRGFWLENQSLTIYDRNTRLFGVVSVPKSIDEAMDHVEEKFDVSLPIGDVLVADPYQNIMAHVGVASHLGKVVLHGVTCNHLAFRGENADFQVWIAEGAAPLIQKIVIDRKREPGAPQLVQIFRSWDLTTPISDSVFTFVAPPGAEKIEVLPRKTEESVAPSPQPEK